jgi:hypothetical protein
MARILGSFLLFILLANTVLLQAAENQDSVSIKFDHITVEDGLSHHEVSLKSRIAGGSYIYELSQKIQDS